MKILLLDGHNVLFRAFTSVPRSVTGKDGKPINGAYGMVATLLRLVRDLGADRALVAFDVPEVPTFRHRLYAPYQGQRGPLGGEHAADFARQVEIAKEVLPTIGIEAVTAPGYEADDVLASFANQMSPFETSGIVVSSDRDLLQLVRTGLAIASPGSPPTITDTAEQVRERFGVLPEFVPDFKALAGDPSDNIPGVQGVGSKTAARLINDSGSLDIVYEKLDELPKRTASLLEAQKEQAYLFRQITRLVADLDLPFSLHDLPELHIESSLRARSVLDSAGY